MASIYFIVISFKLMSSRLTDNIWPDHAGQKKPIRPNRIILMNLHPRFLTKFCFRLIVAVARGVAGRGIVLVLRRAGRVKELALDCSFADRDGLVDNGGQAARAQQDVGKYHCC